MGILQSFQKVGESVEKAILFLGSLQGCHSAQADLWFERLGLNSTYRQKLVCSGSEEIRGIKA